MTDLRTKMENMLFVYETANNSDFRYRKVKQPIPTVHREKPTCYRVRPPPLKDIHTMSKWKNATIPFNLLHKPRDIIDTDPWKIPEPREKYQDHCREQVQKTRPRLIMTPALSVDDIDNPTRRAILCNDVYTSSATRVSRNSVKPYSSIRAPFPGLPAAANPIFLPTLKAPHVSPEWRMESVAWDNKQLKTHCDANKEFWIRYPLPECKACDQTAIVRAHRKMKQD